MDGSTQPYHPGIPMGTDAGQMDEQDVSMFQRHGDLQQNFSGNTSQLGYTNLNTYSMQPLGQTSPNRSLHLGNLHDMYHSSSHTCMPQYKPSGTSPVKASYAGSGVDQFNNGTTHYKPSQPKDYTAIREDTSLMCPSSKTPYKTPVLGITPPKGYTGRGSEYAVTSQYKAPVPENTTTVSMLTDQQQTVGIKPAIYKPRHNISEKDLQLGEPDVSDSIIKSASKDYTVTNLPRELMSKMFGLLKEGMFCDAILFAGNKEIRIHKLVLLAASPFLMSKMTNPLPGESIKVKLPSDIPIEVASQLVHYLYDGKVTLTTENVAQFARIAKLFNLEHLVNICEEFATSYNLGESVLSIPNEDISVEVNEIPGSKPKPPAQSDTEKVAKSITNTSKEDSIIKGAVKRRSKDLNNIDSNIPKVNHVYGTRAASGMVKKKVFVDSVTDRGDNPSVKLNNKKPGFQSTMQNTDNCVGMSEKNKVSMQIDDQKQINDSTILKHPRKRRLSLLTSAQMNSDESKDTGTTESLEMSVHEVQEDHSDENEEDFEPVPQITTQSGMQRAVFEGSRKGKTLKSLKKPPATMYQNMKKGRQKKTLPLVPLINKTETRPPPKKRAREFAEKEIKENSEMIKSESAVLKQAVSNSRQKRKPTKKLKKSIRMSSFSTLGRYTTELEERALEIPESERQFKCNLCNNEFVFPKRCINHVVKTHLLSVAESVNNISIARKEDTPRQCDICGYVTKDQNYYYIHYHKYFRHGVPLPKGWKPYKCDICGKECFTKFQLKDHKLIHTEETPFVCELCGTGFKSRTCLNSHVYHKHSTERKHQCRECDRAFKTKTQLLVHTRTHTGEKPFHCPDCDYKSTTRGNMRLHLTNKHKFLPKKIRDLMNELKVVVYDDADTTKESEIGEGKNDSEDNQPIMVMNEHGQVNVLGNVKVSTATVTSSPEVSHVEPIQSNMSNIMSVSSSVNQSHTMTTSANSQDNRQQYLLQQISVPINIQPVQEINSTDAVTSHLLLPVEQFDQGQTTFSAQVQDLSEESALQETNMVTGIDEVGNLIHGQRNPGHDDQQAMIVQELRQFGQELKGANNETVLQLIQLGRQNQIQVPDNSYSDKLERTDTLSQVHVHNLVRDKQALVQVHIPVHPHMISEDQMEPTMNIEANSKLKSNIALVPVSVHKQMAVVPSSMLNIAPKPDTSSLQSVNTANTVAYVMRPQKGDLVIEPSAGHSQSQVLPIISASVAQPIPSQSHHNYDVSSLLTTQTYTDPNNMYQQYQHYPQNY